MCLIAGWKHDCSPVGGDPPALIYWSLPRWHSVLDRWERDDSPQAGPAGGELPSGTLRFMLIEILVFGSWNAEDQGSSAFQCTTYYSIL